MEKLQIQFESSIAETLLIPLWMRSSESKRQDALLHDPVSEKLVEQIDYDFEKFSIDKRSQVGIALRTRYLDKVVENFVAAHSDAVVVMGGCGLDPRMSRIQAKHSCQCYELDLPEVIAYREKLLPSTQNDVCLAGSLFDTGWMDELKTRHPGSSFLFVVEGVLVYFKEEIVRQFFVDIASRFPGSELYIERMGTMMSRNTKRSSSVHKTQAVFEWGCDDPAIVTAWHPSLRLTDEYYYMKDAPSRVGFMGMLAKLIFWRSCGIWGFKIDSTTQG